MVTAQEYWPGKMVTVVLLVVTVQEYWPVVRCYSTRILASGKMVTVQEYWPVVRWLQYKNIGQW